MSISNEEGLFYSPIGAYDLYDRAEKGLNDRKSNGNALSRFRYEAVNPNFIEALAEGLGREKVVELLRRSQKELMSDYSNLLSKPNYKIDVIYVQDSQKRKNGVVTLGGVNAKRYVEHMMQISRDYLNLYDVAGGRAISKEDLVGKLKVALYTNGMLPFPDFSSIKDIIGFNGSDSAVNSIATKLKIPNPIRTFNRNANPTTPAVPTIVAR